MPLIKLSLVAFLLFMLTMCGNSEDATGKKTSAANPSGLTDFEMENGIGPIKQKIQLGEIDEAQAEKGKAIYVAKCSPCHKIDKRFTAPPQRYTADRRTPEFILNMILNPDEMVKKHPTSKKLMAEYMAVMVNMQLKEEQARQVLEYLRVLAREGHEKNIVADPVFRNKK